MTACWLAITESREPPGQHPFRFDAVEKPGNVPPRAQCMLSFDDVSDARPCIDTLP